MSGFKNAAAFFAGAILLICPSIALANSGTPIMMGRMLHLVFGNALIGLLEAALLAVVFRVRTGRAVLVMILANYVSMIAGLAVTTWVGNSLLRDATILDINRIIWMHWLLLAGSLVASIILEWPFCMWALKDRRLVRGLKASSLAQAVSYAIIVPLYVFFSDLSVARQVQVDPSLVAHAGTQYTIYYVAPDEKTLRAVALNGSGDRFEADLPDLRWAFDLMVVRPDGQDQWYLAKRTSSGNPEQLIAPLGRTIPRPPGCGDSIRAQYWRASSDWAWYFTPEGLERWGVKTSYIFGLVARSSEDYVKVHLSLPYLSWWPACATVLPDDRVVFALEDQICLLDLRTKQIGLIARGKSPFVVPTGQDSTPAASQPIRQAAVR